jgi:hypothetical protein
MKFDKFKSFLEKQYESPDEDWGEDGDESYYNSDDYLFGRPYKSTKSKYYEEDDDNNSSSTSDGMDNICELIRDMFNLSGLKAFVESDEMDITVSVEMKNKDKLKRLLKVLEVAKRLQKDVLVEYECEFEVWETKKEKTPLLVFNFYVTGEAPF